ncbi:hypothetical protein E6O75_ATG11646 [Venturia nashicola]|uniref:Uncharacterized protein n=1 Tax=Venturia nashicola TaxID=86259 RepID=A0A4Z1NPI1_9PEZI|nr:hypothetical protein E6O75_ATG11646 [Venturia nashicola]
MVEADQNQRNGHKRRAPDELERDQRLAKRFDLLNLTNDSKLYVPVSASPHAQASAPIPRPDASNNELMEVEDTKDKVYIYDLDKELAESESDDERPIFIPDIERHLLARIPRHVLIGDDAREAAKHMQMILYSAPKSLTVAPDKDNVRRAIIESRKRSQERQAFTIPAAPETFPSNTTNGFLEGTGEPSQPTNEFVPAPNNFSGFHAGNLSPETMEEDTDVMDMD